MSAGFRSAHRGVELDSITTMSVAIVTIKMQCIQQALRSMQSAKSIKICTYKHSIL